MTTTTFDTLKYAKQLKEAGFSEMQAEIQAEALREIIDNNLTTKRDLKDLEKNLLIKLGGLMIAGITALSILVSILSRLH